METQKGTKKTKALLNVDYLGMLVLGSVDLLVASRE